MGLVMTLVGDGLGRDLPPLHLARGAVVTCHDEAVEMCRRRRAPFDVGRRLGHLLRLGQAIGLLCRDDENVIGPDDGRGAAAANEWRFPAYVLAAGAVPGCWRIGLGSAAIGV